ncbi:hypothetical protein VF14_13130 [Nostoc linckia z18]|uniref:Uncharacterized protein n=2 Tax=Nostoc linckia TaxID=92942 RepID=A0A9Q5ZCW0_NOSLI|nr:hypothetical protein VF02_16280 [Nostoc linckia z1]PHJ66830.1 hypothetical protein VF05_18370 [Nostoc linckia z3]PHJ70244.1 hypothetical protein VF03_22520 [Nostoc linckia z2]PHJ79507.1 hypothetical protein VF06_25640 [Nostoc linckia z4]PHJ84309.1 hypothetical protein VF07_25595 [Nostoc linckia z6]PHJ96678.1 hypothetical protein VF04_15160 [Nostoc linckia z7]PHK03328.1 hypothetical protein VF09_30110 [Nostoc linckia z9]PHK03977.1 hypothetical protein VF08_13015 [Nostoc linckia z8]PHK2072
MAFFTFGNLSFQLGATLMISFWLTVGVFKESERLDAVLANDGNEKYRAEEVINNALKVETVIFFIGLFP